MGRLPSSAGACQLTIAAPALAIAVTLVGLPGMVPGVTGSDASEAGPSPVVFVATTVNV